MWLFSNRRQPISRPARETAESLRNNSSDWYLTEHTLVNNKLKLRLWICTGLFGLKFYQCNLAGLDLSQADKRHIWKAVKEWMFDLPLESQVNKTNPLTK